MLDKELAYFETIKEELLANHDGKFALISEEKFIDSFDTPSNAYAEGIKRFGKTLFLVKRISASDNAFASKRNRS